MMSRATHGAVELSNLFVLCCPALPRRVFPGPLTRFMWPDVCDKLPGTGGQNLHPEAEFCAASQLMQGAPGVFPAKVNLSDSH